MTAWLAHHAHSAGLACQRLAASPVNSILSLLAIGIALALPSGGQMLLAGARHLAAGAVTTPQISVFMNLNAARGATEEVRLRLEKHDGIARTAYLPREETLARMKANPGLRDVIEALAANPFPDAFVVTLRDEAPQAMERVAVELRKLPGVEHVQLDSAWVKRLDALLRLGRTSLLLLAFLLGGGLVAITFSVIRMQVLTQQAEIEVSRLLGATEAFIRRPFLYHGFLLGLGGGAVAWLLVAGAALWLRVPIAELAGLYDLKFELEHLSAIDSALLLAGAAALGWTGALFSLRQGFAPSRA
jgi:cell division transport system permease protein